MPTRCRPRLLTRSCAALAVVAAFATGCADPQAAHPVAVAVVPRAAVAPPAAVAALAADASSKAAARELARDVFLIAGDVPEERGPDGNTVIFRARDGLVVVDTGRHVEHSDAILAFAAAERRPIVAIVNTHWHLDHSSGNRRLLDAFPGAPVYTSRAIDRALAPGGFLARGVAPAEQRLARADLSPLQREETTLFLATMAASNALRPTVAIASSHTLALGGKPFDVRIAEHAVSDADVWLYDPATRIAVVGDLVTLPAPFLDTACPRAWREALDSVAATPFAMLVPGHGEPMSRVEFETYRAAFGSYLTCVASEHSSATCATQWATAIAGLQRDDERLHAAATPYAKSYADFLREHGGTSPGCQQVP